MAQQQQQLFDEEYIKSTGGIIYDGGYDNAPNIPDAQNLMTDLMQVMEFMATDAMLELKSQDKNEYERVVEEKYPAFVDRYYFVFKMLSDANPYADISPLFAMIKEIDKMNKGKTDIEKAEKRLGGYLASKYIPDSLRNMK
jgi:hypothetical protein